MTNELSVATLLIFTAPPTLAALVYGAYAILSFTISRIVDLDLLGFNLDIDVEDRK